ncbi:peptidase inhibitor family I36 protein [Streptomyces sp. NPDC046984]|uniref:peptidase inhibitor family I36 protein n=1 Tax=Streptomyces sp. NPDC046984 TaxID=3155138 RepID=UPI0033D1BA3A
MRSHLRALIPVAALAVGGVLLSTAPANAAASDCKANYVCVFEHTSWDGRSISQAVDSGTKWNIGSGLNDKTSSVINNTDKTVILYQDYNGGGLSTIIYPHSSRSDLYNVNIFNPDGSYHHTGTFNDRASSFKLVG